MGEQIGEGGTGAVYRSVQPKLNREVAIKVLNPAHASYEAKQRFGREALLASRLRHPCATHIYAVGELDGRVWIAMELLQGVTLASWLRKHVRMPIDAFVPFFAKLADVVQHAHDRGIVHRDLKPSNVMVIEESGERSPKLLDLGVAKAPPDLDSPIVWPDSTLGENQSIKRKQNVGGQVTVTDANAGNALTPAGVAMGSWAYMSPEQWMNASNAGPASDIYSLGVLAYQSLTGRLPFYASNFQGYCSHHLGTKVPTLGGDLAQDFDHIFQRALAKDPRQRYGSTVEMATELRNALHRRRARRGTAIRRWVAAIALLLVFGLGMGMFKYRAEMQAQVAQEQVRAAERVVAATFTQAELERGRAALLHGEPEAETHLALAYKRGDRTSGTQFMLARALQPRSAELARFASTGGRMWSAVFSPDGLQIATADDKGATVWDAQTYQRQFTLPHDSEVYRVIYSTNGAKLITVSRTDVRVWDSRSGKLLNKLSAARRDGKPNDYFVGAVSSSGSFVSAMDADGKVTQVWNLETGAPLAELVGDKARRFPCLSFSSDGRWLAVGGGDDVRIYDVSTWALQRTLPGPRIESVAFAPVGSRLVTGSATGDVSLWDVQTGARIQHLADIGDRVNAVAFARDGGLVAAGNREGAIHIWATESGLTVNHFNTRQGSVVALEFGALAKYILAAGRDGTVVIADVQTGLPVSVLEGSRSTVVEAHFAPSSRFVLGASRDGTARVWDAGAPYQRWSSPPMSDDCGVMFHRQAPQRFVAAACRSRPVRIWDTQRDKLIGELPAASQVDGDFASSFPVVSATGDRAAIAHGNLVDVYELPTGKLLFSAKHQAPVNTVSLSSAGHDLVSGAIDGSVIVTREHGAVLELPRALAGIDTVAFLPGDRIAVTDARHHLRIFDGSGTLLSDLELPLRVRSLSVGSSKLVAIPLYSVDAAPPVLVDFDHYRLDTLLGHVGPVYSARWVLHDRIITSGDDGTARLWSGENGRQLQVYQGRSRFLADATMTPDGSMVIAGGAGGLLTFWDAQGPVLWTLRAHKSDVVGLHMVGDEIVTRGFDGSLSRWKLPDPRQVIDACYERERCAIVGGP